MAEPGAENPSNTDEREPKAINWHAYGGDDCLPPWPQMKARALWLEAQVERHKMEKQGGEPSSPVVEDGEAIRDMSVRDVAVRWLWSGVASQHPEAVAHKLARGVIALLGEVESLRSLLRVAEQDRDRYKRAHEVTAGFANDKLIPRAVRAEVALAEAQVAIRELTEQRDALATALKSIANWPMDSLGSPTGTVVRIHKYAAAVLGGVGEGEPNG